jgi:ribonuclease D
MRPKLFTFRYSATLGGFDDSALADFIRDKEVVSFREHFFCVNEVPHLVCVLVWQDAVISERDLTQARAIVPHHAPSVQQDGANRRAEKRGDENDLTAGMDERERALFNTLREWRGRVAHEEGVPRYVVFTNRQLVELVRRQPDSPTALAHIAGVGPGKIKRYGRAVLALLAAVREARNETAGSAEPGSPLGDAEPAPAGAEVPA